jgi:hypothetical protein
MAGAGFCSRDFGQSERRSARRVRGWRDSALRVGTAFRCRLGARNAKVSGLATAQTKTKGTAADDQPADCQAAAAAEGAQQGSGPAGEPAEARRLHPRLHDHTEEAELGVA